MKEQETELDTRRSELQKLKEEEASLEHEYDDGLKELENLSHQLQDTQLQISQVKAMVSQLEEIQRQMTDALAMCRSAIEANDPMLVTEYSLKIEPEFREFKQALEKKQEPSAEVADPFSEGGAKVESSGIFIYSCSPLLSHLNFEFHQHLSTVSTLNSMSPSKLQDSMIVLVVHHHLVTLTMLLEKPELAIHSEKVLLIHSTIKLLQRM